jgi:hypothetical protein
MRKLGAIAATMAAAALALTAAATSAAASVTGEGSTVTYQAHLAPEKYLPAEEAAKVKELAEGGRIAGCANNVERNTFGFWWADFWDESLQLYWCWNYMYVSYAYRNRWVNGSRFWIFQGYIGWGEGGCIGCWGVSAWSQAHWRLPRPGLWDMACYPQEYVSGTANGAWSNWSNDQCT